MRYLFSIKSIQPADIGVVIITKDQADLLNLQKYFPKTDFTVINHIGIKFVKVYKNQASGYLVYRNKKIHQIEFYRYEKRKIYVTIKKDNIIGVIKYETV